MGKMHERKLFSDKSDKESLIWIYNRLKEFHRDAVTCNHMKKLKAIAECTPEKRVTTIPSFSSGLPRKPTTKQPIFNCTKKAYIKRHGRSLLGKELAANPWPDSTKLEIINGSVSPGDKSSKLYRALQQSKLKEYTVGSIKQQPNSFWIAVA